MGCNIDFRVFSNEDFNSLTTDQMTISSSESGLCRIESELYHERELLGHLVTIMHNDDAYDYECDYVRVTKPELEQLIQLVTDDQKYGDSKAYVLQELNMLLLHTNWDKDTLAVCVDF